MNASCPISLSEYPLVTLGHGGGGGLTHELIEKLFAPAFGDPKLDVSGDGAVLQCGTARRWAFSTDSHVVSPLFFPGGDIGKLAVFGTVNDLAMCGSRPKYLSVGFVLEEGFSMESLWRIVQSMKAAAKEAGVRIVTGDTKVVEKGKGDGVYINTSGIGEMEHSMEIGPRSIVAGDVILLSGDIGRHGVAVMGAREGLRFETALQSDCACLAGLVEALLGAGLPIHCLRDLTRGGLATCLVELAESSGLTLQIDEQCVPVCAAVRGACEMLGLDPAYVANEGRCVVIVPEEAQERALMALRRCPVGSGALRIGKVDKGEGPPLALAATGFGTRRALTRLSGEQLPRIC